MLVKSMDINFSILSKLLLLAKGPIFPLFFCCANQCKLSMIFYRNLCVNYK